MTPAEKPVQPVMDSPPKAKSRPTDPVPTAPSVAVAPAPHRAPLNRPPANFTSAWVRRGEVRTRVIGAKVIRPVLTNDSGDEFLSPDHYLLIWVETQSVTAANVPLRRWQNPLNEFATLTDAKGTVIKSAKFSGGARVGGQLEGGHNLIPGGPAVVDVLAFEDPGTTARNLRLELTASHVREGGEFVHEIPASAWSK